MNFIISSNIHVVDVCSGAWVARSNIIDCRIKAVTLVEANSKKSVFLLQAAQISSNKIEIINS